MITRHNRVRNITYRISSDGFVSPEMEKAGILGPGEGSGRRPADVDIPAWSDGKSIAIDVAIINPLSKSNVKHDVPCASYGVDVKIAKYQASFEGTQYEFIPIMFETSGAVNSHGVRVLKQLFRFAAKMEGVSYSVYSHGHGLGYLVVYSNHWVR
jgi:hypothetical protein